jgi:hypothetical protein
MMMWCSRRCDSPTVALLKKGTCLFLENLEKERLAAFVLQNTFVYYTCSAEHFGAPKRAVGCTLYDRIMYVSQAKYVVAFVAAFFDLPSSLFLGALDSPPGSPGFGRL